MRSLLYKIAAISEIYGTDVLTMKYSLMTASEVKIVVIYNTL